MSLDPVVCYFVASDVDPDLCAKDGLPRGAHIPPHPDSCEHGVRLKNYCAKCAPPVEPTPEPREIAEREVMRMTFGAGAKEAEARGWTKAGPWVADADRLAAEIRAYGERRNEQLREALRRSESNERSIAADLDEEHARAERAEAERDALRTQVKELLEEALATANRGIDLQRAEIAGLQADLAAVREERRKARAALSLKGPKPRGQVSNLPLLIVSRHAGAVEWLRRRGIEGRVIEHATPDDVRGRFVYGVLPFHLAALAKEIVMIDTPSIPLDRRGGDLSPEEMDRFGATLTRYMVIQVAGLPEEANRLGEIAHGASGEPKP